MNGTIVVFARTPERGRAKTRLIPELGPDLAHALYGAMLTDTLRNARKARARVVLAHTPGAPFAQQRMAHALVEQQGATFGERFDHALRAAWEEQPGPIVLLGADTPHVGPERLRGAMRALGPAAAALGPSQEGGFWLLGLREAPLPLARAFDEPNEASGVVRILRRTRDVALLEPTFDLDVPADLVSLLMHAEVLDAAGLASDARETLRVAREADLRVESAGAGGRMRRLVAPAR